MPEEGEAERPPSFWDLFDMKIKADNAHRRKKLGLPPLPGDEELEEYYQKYVRSPSAPR